MAKKKLIPTAAEVEARREAINKEKLEQEKQKMISFLQQKTLKVLFTFQIGLEAMDFLVPTEFYHKGKDMKRDGNRFVKALEREVSTRVDGLYKHDPTFSTNMFREVEEVMDKMAHVDFADFPVLNKVLDDFIQNKEQWRDKAKIEFNNLDVQ